MFNPQQKHTILAKLGYNGPTDDKVMEQFVASNPAAAAKIGRFENAAKKIMTPPPQMQMAEGGVVEQDTSGTNAVVNAAAEPAPLPTTTSQGIDFGIGVTSTVNDTLRDIGEARDKLDGGHFVPRKMPDGSYALINKNGRAFPVTAHVAKRIGMDTAIAGYGTGAAAAVSTADLAADASGGATAGGTGGATAGGLKTWEVKRSEDILKASTGEIPQAAWMDVNGDGKVTSADALAQERLEAGLTAEGYDRPGLLERSTADYMSVVPTIENTTDMGETQLSGQDLNAIKAAQITEGTGQITGDVTKVTAETADVDTAETPQEVETITYDATKVSGEVAAELEKLKAATGQPSELATVRGQMSLLMQDFDDGTPPWASGAMRSAMQTMTARGLGASSMAGQAIVQAAMESALPIAGADARTQAEFEIKNLDNEQQTRIFKTQQRISGLLSDQAADNAAKTFNAQSQNQINMFNENLQSSVKQFNASQINAIRQFNAGETNAISKFNADMLEQRSQFNAKNDVLVQQANVQFRNSMFEAKMNIKSTEAITQANITSQERIQKAARDAERKMAQAQLAHQSAQNQLAREQQAEQAALERVFQAEQSQADRALTVLTTTMAADTQKELASMAATDSEKSGIGQLIGTVLGLS